MKLKYYLTIRRPVYLLLGIALVGFFFPRAFSVRLNAQNSSVKLPIINIQKTSWKVLFQGFISEFGSDPPSSEMGKMLVSVAKSLNQLSEHVLDENEKDKLREKAIQTELFKHYKAYNSLVNLRDRAVINATLKGRSGFNQITAQGAEEKKVRDKAILIKRIENMNRDLISVPDSLPLEFEDHGNQPYKPPNIVLLKDDYDIFIWGVANGKGNVFQVGIWAYIANAKRKVLLWKGFVGNNNYDEALEMIEANVSALLLGRPWAALKVEVETSNGSDAKIYLNGKLQGENVLTIRGLYPKRSYELEIIASGLQGRHFFVELEPGKLNSFRFQLDAEVPEKYIKVDASTPADVYLGVRYMGQTPLEITVPAYETLLVLVAKGKRTLNYDLSPKQDGDLFFNMEVAPEITLKKENDKWRTRFYWSSALFMISLALPILTTGVTVVNQGLYAYNRNNGYGRGYQQSMYIGLGFAIGGGVLSGALLGLNIYDFTRYTKSIQALTATDFQKVPPEEARGTAAGP